MALATFGGEDLSVDGGELVGGGDLRLLDEDLLQADAQTIAWGALAGVTVKDDLGADVSDGVFEQAVRLQQGVERVDVGLHGRMEGREGGTIGGRMAKLSFTSEGVEVGRPVRRRVRRWGAAGWHDTARDGRAPGRARRRKTTKA